MTIRNVNPATWRRFKAEAAQEGQELGPYLSGVLVDWCDYYDDERAKAAKK